MVPSSSLLPLLLLSVSVAALPSSRPYVHSCKVMPLPPVAQTVPTIPAAPAGVTPPGSTGTPKADELEVAVPGGAAKVHAVAGAAPAITAAPGAEQQPDDEESEGGQEEEKEDVETDDGAVASLTTGADSGCTHLVIPKMGPATRDVCTSYGDLTQVTAYTDCQGCALKTVELGPGPVVHCGSWTTEAVSTETITVCSSSAATATA